MFMIKHIYMILLKCCKFLLGFTTIAVAISSCAVSIDFSDSFQVFHIPDEFLYISELSSYFIKACLQALVWDG